MTEGVEVKDILRTDEITRECLGWHNEFDQKIWKNEASFHNAEHIRATIIAAEILVEKALTGNDPLKIMDDLEKWNREHPSKQIEREELSKVVRLAFASHDLGNIAQEATEQDGKVSLIFLPQYMAKGGEDRSQKIAKTVMENSKIPEEQKRKWLPLVQHLINETKFMLEGKVSFGVFTRVVDQIGNNLFNTNEKMVIGLLKEMLVENPQAEFTPYSFFNFAKGRFGQLVPNENTRASILEIWGKKLPEDKKELSQKPVKVEDWLKEK